MDIEAGFMLIVESSENDGDNKRQLIISGLSEAGVHFFSKICKLLRSRHSVRFSEGEGSLAFGNGELDDEGIDQIIDLCKKYEGSGLGSTGANFIQDVWEVLVSEGWDLGNVLPASDWESETKREFAGVLEDHILGQSDESLWYIHENFVRCVSSVELYRVPSKIVQDKEFDFTKF